MREQSAGYGMFGHGYTYSGHPVPAAVALETLKIYEERNLVPRVLDLAPRFSKAFRELEEHPMIGTSRSLGLIGALELVRDKKKKEFFDPSQKKSGPSGRRGSETLPDPRPFLGISLPAVLL